MWKSLVTLLCTSFEIVIDFVTCGCHVQTHLQTTCKTLFDWKMASKFSCIFCQKDTAPGNRVYLKSGQEPLVSVIEFLITVHGRSGRFF